MSFKNYRKLKSTNKQKEIKMKTNTPRNNNIISQKKFIKANNETNIGENLRTIAPFSIRSEDI